MTGGQLSEAENFSRFHILLKSLPSSILRGHYGMVTIVVKQIPVPKLLLFDEYSQPSIAPIVLSYTVRTHRTRKPLDGFS
jgi:hypothetical protein